MNRLFSLRPVFVVDKGEHDYVNVSPSAGQIGGGGGGGVEKLCVPGYALYCTVFTTCEHLYTK